MDRPFFLALALAACTAASPRPDAPQTPAAPPPPDSKRRPSPDAALVPPVAGKIPKDVTVHADKRIDDYFWLREKDTPKVLEYLRAEAAYTDAAFAKPTSALREHLYAELLSRIKEDDAAPPYRESGWLWSMRTEKGKPYPIYERRKSPDAPAQVTLDVNELAAGKKFLQLGAQAPNDDATLLAYSIDDTGYRQYALHVKDLRTGQTLAESIPRVDSFVWASDGRTLYYVVEDKVAKRPFQLYRHTVGSASPDALLFEEKDEMFDLAVHRSRDRALIFVESESHTASEVRFFAAADPSAKLTLIEPRSKDHEYFADHRNGLLYIRTNSGGRNFRLVTAPVQKPGRSSWTELVPHREDVMLAGVELFRDFLVLEEREQGLPQYAVVDLSKLSKLSSGARHRIEFPEAAYDLRSGWPAAPNREFDTDLFRFQYSSMVTPPSIFDYRMSTRERTLLKEQPVLGGYDKSRYEVERLSAPAPDGTPVPLTLLHRKGIARDGSSPLFLTGYGSYGASSPVSFSSERFSLVDRGITFAIAHVRGGGELGKKWHDQGRMMNKRNTFTDFVASAEHLIERGYTSKEKLVIEGGSAGGLLMGAVLNLRPDLFHAAIVAVPFVDVLNTMLDESLPLTTGEFEEWGNPKIESEYRYMRSYSPYDNLEARAYPAMLVKSSYNDSQVMYWEPAKYVARLRALKTDHNPLYFKINLEPSGHGGASGRYDRLREIAFDDAFVLNELGLKESKD